MAVFLSISAREIISKIFAIWMPVMCFVGLGTDHVIANMYFIPMAIFVGSPNISVGYYIWKSMIPSALGNIVGGGLFVGGVYWYLYLAGNEVEIHFDESVQDHAVFEQGGPIDGRVPDSAGNARSGVA
jgi:formate/nitrite transporter FocA (FNT family)